MRKTGTLQLIVLAAVITLASSAWAWDPADPLNVARAAADRELFGAPAGSDAERPDFRVHHNLLWEDGTLMSGVARLVDRLEETGTPVPRYVDYVEEWGKANPGYYLAPIVHGDQVCAGETYIWLYERSGKTSNHLKRTNGMIDFIFLGRKPAQWGTGYHSYWMRFWNDDTHMVPPFLARRGRAAGNKGTLNGKDAREIAIIYDRAYADILQDKSNGLFWHDRRTIGQYMWGRGNGWVAAGFTKVLDYIKDDPAYADDAAWLRAQLVQMAATLKDNRNAWGTWNADVLDHETYVMPENSGTAFFTFMMAYLINEGTLSDEYVPVVQKAWHFLTLSIKDDGYLMHVQPVGAGPVTKDFQDNSMSYGVGGFLMAAVEMSKMDQSVLDGAAGIESITLQAPDLDIKDGAAKISMEKLSAMSPDFKDGFTEIRAAVPGHRLPDALVEDGHIAIKGLPGGYEGPVVIFFKK